MAQSSPRVTVSLKDLQDEFRAQLQLLKNSCVAYDAGQRDEFRRIALAVRVLVYDHRQSKSLIGQLGLKSIPFAAYSPPVDPANLLTSMTLVGIKLSGQIAYFPKLDGSAHEHRLLDFNEWWDEEVFRSPSGVSMSRSGFVLHTANQGGGAHVDPEIDERFFKIAKANEAGWMARFGEVETPMMDLEKACVRHIGCEVLNTLEPEWKKIQGSTPAGGGLI